MKKILFVCCANRFRSLSAEKLMKQYMNKHKIKGIKVDSAGIKARKSHRPTVHVRKRRAYYGIRFKFKPHHISKKLIKEHDIVIAMDHLQKEYIKKNYGLTVPLFNEAAYGKRTDVRDFYEEEYDMPYEEMKKIHKKVTYNTIDYIRKAIPKVVTWSITR